MKGFVYALSLFFAITESGAQTLLKRYYNKEDFQTDSASSYYFEMRTLEGDSDPPLISYYTVSNKIRFKEGFKDEQGVKLRTYYYPNNVVKAEGAFNVTGPQGLVYAFYEDGRRQAELFYEEGKEVDNKELIVGIINYWDSLGNHIIENGSGYCHCNLSLFTDQILIERGLVADGLKSGEWEGKGVAGNTPYTFKEWYTKGILVQGTQTWAGNTYTYDHLKKIAAPVGGMKSFYENIAENLRYPTIARKKNIQGIVYVDFVIGESGYLQDVNVAKGFDKVCDEEAIRAVKLSPKWSPAYIRGRPVKKSITLPIIFKLRI